MALSRDEIFLHPDLHAHIKVQSASLVGMFQQDARLSAVFATQQRWLMSHVGLALYFRGVTAGSRTGLHITTFLQAVDNARIASRNTADSYIKEMIKYKYIEMLTLPEDKRVRPLVPAPHVLMAITGWLRIHLASLDSLVGGDRLAIFDRDPSIIAQIQPIVADGLVTARAVRHPEKTFSLFTWLDNGGLVMDWVITSMENAPMSAERVAVGNVSTVEMAHRLNLSRTHLARKLREAESMGSIGWEGRRGHSVMWVSRGFREEYAGAQAVKLSIIDHACEAVLGTQALQAQA
ncbi:MAG: hypothetical protein JWL86_829 [Rhizobium sp.]|nr:hypothetical protein [Rhizobium sp.]